MANALETAALALLALVVTTAGELGVTLPARRYVSPGAAGNEAWDDEQVTVALVQLQSMHAALPGEQVASTLVPAGVVSLPTAALRAEIVRCVPVVELRPDGTQVLPPAADDQAAALVLLADAWLLHTVRSRALKDAALTSGGASQIRTGAVQPVGPEGGLAAVNLEVSVTLL